MRLRFFSTVLRLNGGQFEGKPFELHPAQAFIVGSLFGWNARDGTRRFRFAYIEQGKGNGKSPLVAGIGLYCMVADGEARAEIYAAATKKDQAMILFRDAVAMVDQSPALATPCSSAAVATIRCGTSTTSAAEAFSVRFRRRWTVGPAPARRP
jgi:phage terminase large subunit-like protein